MQPKKLLQLHDIACCAATLAAYLEEKGWHCLILKREVFDSYRCGGLFHNYKLTKGKAIRFYFEVLKTIKRFRPSIILVHSQYSLLPLVKLAAPRIPIIIQFHGSDVRYRKTLPWEARLAALCIVSTKDLTRWGEYYGVPISHVFKPAVAGYRRKGTALFIRTNRGAKDCLNKAKRVADEKGLKLTVIDRTKGESVPHIKMPALLGRFEWYLDLKGLTSKLVISKTAIEFLHTTSPKSRGMVLTDSDEVVDTFEGPTNTKYLDLLEKLTH